MVSSGTCSTTVTITTTITTKTTRIVYGHSVPMPILEGDKNVSSNNELVKSS
jgi:hypothetical protein